MSTSAQPKSADRFALQNKVGEVFARLHYKVTQDVKNNTQSTLALDLLQTDVKKDLLAITTTTLEETFLNLLTSSEPFSDKKSKSGLLALIKKITEKFLTNHYGCEIDLPPNFLTRSSYVNFLLADHELLFITPLSTLAGSKNSKFRLLFSPIYNYASETFVESLLDNLILEISNCIVYLVIVDFGPVYVLRQTIYQSRFLSLRNLERFKNNLSWQAKIRMQVQRPLDLYNNCYGLYIIRANGIYYRTVYANRSNEIKLLTGIPLLSILFVESKDFVLSRLDEIFYTVGNGFRYLLTDSLGQIIALLWRGVIEGLKKGK
jgi:hypothetical protein|tara:strand:+ start:3264 stop:4220 length:957 start_codon:yes stop_codon:yes gene_type:complete